MQITVISDTHGLHNRIETFNSPLQNNLDWAGKMIIHAGDITEYGREDEILDFLEWFSNLPHQYKLFVGGNHDLFLEHSPLTRIGKMIPKGIGYLYNSGMVVEGIRIWGSPVTPYFMGTAFNKKRGKEIKKVWECIPAQTDILITHGAPFSIMDDGFGCKDLLGRVREIKPKYHLFGHSHGHSGISKVGETIFINAALVDSPDPLEVVDYTIIAEPILFEYEHNARLFL